MADLAAIEAIEADMREQAQGSQDGWLLDAANRLKSELTRAKGTGEAVAWRHRSDMDGIWTWAYTGDPAQAEVYRRKGHEVEPLYASPPVALPEGCVSVKREKLEYVRDLLMERVYGSPARSPSHNARLEVQDMLSSSPQAKEGGS